MTAGNLLLPKVDGSLERYELSGTPFEPLKDGRAFKSRVVYAAVHVVCDPLRASASSAFPDVDWDATLAYRSYLWSMGFGVAEGMDTAQRGMGLTWEAARELIGRSLAASPDRSDAIACGAGTDQLDPTTATLDEVIAAYEEQCGYVESAGGRVVLMASRALARSAQGPDDYLAVYDKVLSQLTRPATLHWLGEAFDPALSGYWGPGDLAVATETFVALVEAHASKIEGVKVSLLDKQLEIGLRERLPEGVRVYTGDDFNYVELIRGDDRHHSHALLGILDAIAPVAAVALRALDEGDGEVFEKTLASTVPLARHVFSAPTRFYKTGLIFLAYLNGHQSHFRMLAGLESARSVVHLTETFVLADQAGLLRDPEMAGKRMQAFLTTAGVD
ncbi:MAG: dihydrodipicolinate synthase family protein [Actinomycetota bacterium]